MNAGIRLQKFWRWNGKPLRVKITRMTFNDGATGFRIEWQRWFPRGRRAGWQYWRSYTGAGSLRDIIERYRDYADDWRGHGDF